MIPTPTLQFEVDADECNRLATEIDLTGTQDSRRRV